MDVEDLRRQFEDYRSTHTEIAGTAYPILPPTLPPSPVLFGARHVIEDVEPADDEREREREHEVVVFRPGMTLEQLEEKAIIAALKEVQGNRRKAAEMLGMGERTLYRKIKEYDIPL